MEPHEVFFGIFAVLGMVVVAPTWTYFVNTHTPDEPAMQFLATAVLPLTAMYLVASWLQPG